MRKKMGKSHISTIHFQLSNFPFSLNTSTSTDFNACEMVQFFLRQLLALLKKICRFPKMYVFVEVETSFIRFSYNLIFNILKDKIFRHIFLLFE